ncbi:MAG: type 4a pilus biogenesis protein PilO [Candidatus Omnitrophota bacterium]|nr:type 4a pilus biogenesis protein PilO [Candidatus Omnitrophota bacterium]
MLTIESNKRNALILSITGIILFILTAFLYLPLAKEIRVKSYEWNSLRSQLAAAHANLSAAGKESVTKRLIRREDVSSVIDGITKEGRNLRLNFKSISQKEIIDTEDGYLVLPVQMEIEGDYERLGRFFGVLENLEGSIVRVKDFEIRRDDKILPKVSASLAINLYLVKE